MPIFKKKVSFKTVKDAEASYKMVYKNRNIRKG
jgi:hypothetical protein